MYQVFDTHRLAYKNARLRAFKLDNKTERLHWFNITETNTAGDDVGVIVYTNEQGYVCYGQNRQRVTSLALTESAIIQVSLDGGINWPIEWIAKVDRGLAPENVGILYYADGSVAFDPTKAGRTVLRDFALASEISQGSWSEEQIYLTDNDVEPSKWTKVIFVNLDALDNQTVKINTANIRYGQLLVVYNTGTLDITIRGEGLDGSDKLRSGEGAVLVADVYISSAGNKWLRSVSTLKTLKANVDKLESDVETIDNNITAVKDSMFTNGISSHTVGENTHLDITSNKPQAINVVMNHGTDTTSSVTIDSLPDGPTVIWFSVTTNVTTVSNKCVLYYGAKQIGTAVGGEPGIKVKLTPRGNYLEVETIDII